MNIDATFHLGDIIMSVIGLVVVVLLKPIFSTLVEMRDTLRTIAPKVEQLEKQTARHHDWLIEMRSKFGFKAGSTNGAN
jgi:hypothetical protein